MRSIGSWARGGAPARPPGPHAGYPREGGKASKEGTQPQKLAARPRRAPSHTLSPRWHARPHLRGRMTRRLCLGGGRMRRTPTITTSFPAGRGGGRSAVGSIFRRAGTPFLIFSPEGGPERVEAPRESLSCPGRALLTLLPALLPRPAPCPPRCTPGPSAPPRRAAAAARAARGKSWLARPRHAPAQRFCPLLLRFSSCLLPACHLPLPGCC